MEYLALQVAVFLGGIVCGFAGFAFSAPAGAILLHFQEPLLAIPLMMACSIASQMTSLMTLRRFLAWRQTLPLLVGGAAGLPLALYLLTSIDPHTFRIGFGLFLAAYAGYMFARPALAPIADHNGAVTHSAVGFASGLVGGLTAMPGALPAIWCDLKRVPKELQRGLVQPFIVGMQVLALVILACKPQGLHQDLIYKTLLALPALAVGTVVGIWLFGRIDERRFRNSVLLLLFVSGCLMVL
jgi:uncharacterized protein